MGRFINEDVFISTGLGLLGCNMFAYCLNNPTMLADPGGFVPSKDIFEVSLGCDDKSLDETLSDYINRNLPDDVKEESLKQAEVYNRTMDAAANEVLAALDNAAFVYVLSLPSGAPVITLGAVVTTIGISFFYGAVKGFVEAVKDVYG